MNLSLYVAEKDINKSNFEIYHVNPEEAINDIESTDEHICRINIKKGMQLISVSYTHLDVYKRQVTVCTSPFREFFSSEFSETTVELLAVEFTGFSAANVVVAVPKISTQANTRDKSLKRFVIDFSSIHLA